MYGVIRMEREVGEKLLPKPRRAWTSVRRGGGVTDRFSRQRQLRVEEKRLTMYSLISSKDKKRERDVGKVENECKRDDADAETSDGVGKSFDAFN